MKFAVAMGVHSARLRSVYGWIRSNCSAPIAAFFSCYLLSVAGAFCGTPYEDVSLLAIAGFSIWAPCLFVTALMLMFGRFTKVFVVPLVIYLAFVVAIKAFLNLVMNMGEPTLGVEWVGILLNSSWQEIGEFVSMFCCRSDVIVGAIVLLFVLTSSVLLIVKGKCPTVSLAPATVGSLLALPFVIMLFARAFMAVPLIRQFDIRFDCNVGQGYEQYHEIALASRNEDFEVLPRYVPQAPEFPVIVITIGESATRNHWGLYGYYRDTTPEMSAIADRLAVFRYAEATHPFTATSLKRIFTDATASENSRARYAFPRMLKAAGFETVLISAQNHWGEFDGLDAILFESCDEKIYLSDICGYGTYYDDAVLPHLGGVLNRARKAPLVVFLHLYGSHFLFASRYPSSFDPFNAAGAGGGRLVAEYDNSIAYTDKVLGDVVRMLQKVESPAAMIYFSDHGESFGSVYRSMSDPNMRDIPMVVWCSDSYRSVAPDVMDAINGATNRRFTTDRMLQGLSRLCWLEWNGYRDDHDFLADDFADKSSHK